MRRLAFLSDNDVERIIDAALIVLEKVGMHIGSPRVLERVGDHDGAVVDRDRVTMRRSLVERCLKTTPSAITVYGQDDRQPLRLTGDNIHYVPDSSVPYIYDTRVRGCRQALAQDFVDLLKVGNRCENIDFVSGSLVVSDVPKPVTAAYRSFLCLLYSPKPLFTSAFGTDDIVIIHELFCAMAGGREAFDRRPIGLIGLNPSSPLGLTEIVASNLAYCAENNLSTMLIPIPLAGGSSPVTLAGTLVQHTAENLGALVVSQCIRPGHGLLFGGGPSIMDMRKGTACQASPEAVMMGASIGQIAKRLNLPCATNAGRADSKRVDYQAGQESGSALTLMALAGINMIRGAGMVEYANVMSPEKMLLDNEVCGMAKRITRGVDVSEETLALDVILERGTTTQGFMSAPHTLKWFRTEAHLPSGVIDRGTRREFEESNGMDAYARARARMDVILAEYQPRTVDSDRVAEATRIISAYAKKHGMERLPITDLCDAGGMEKVARHGTR